MSTRPFARLLSSLFTRSSQGNRRYHGARLRMEAMEDRLVPSQVMYENTYAVNGPPGGATVALTVTADAPGHAGEYLWNYRVTNGSYDIGDGLGMGLFAVSLDPAMVTSMGSSTGWPSGFGLMGDPNVVWMADGAGPHLGVGAAADFWFTTAPAGVGTSYLIASDYMFSGGCDGFGAGPVLMPVVSITDEQEAYEWLAPIQPSGLWQGVFRLTRTGDTSTSLTVSYEVLASSTATPGQDYTTLSGSITFAAGSASVDVLVAQHADNLVEDTETVTIRLVSGSNPAYAIGPNGTASIDLVDDPPLVWVDDASAFVPEGGSGQVVIRRAGGNLSQPLNVTLTIAPGDIGVPPVWGQNFVVTGPTLLTLGTNTLTFAPGEGTISLAVQGQDDNVFENTGHLRFTLSGGTSAVIPSWRSQADVVILDQPDVNAAQDPLPPAPNVVPNMGPGPGGGTFPTGQPGVTTLSAVGNAVGGQTFYTAATALVPPGGKLVNLRLEVTDIQITEPLLIVRVGDMPANLSPRQDAQARLQVLRDTLAAGFLLGRLVLQSTNNPAQGANGVVLQNNTIASRTILAPVVLPNLDYFDTGVLRYWMFTLATVTYQGQYTVGVSVPQFLAPGAVPFGLMLRPPVQLGIPRIDWNPDW